MTTVYYAIARCQHGKGGCQDAASYSDRASILSPDFRTTEDLDQWLAAVAHGTQRRRCRSCRRPIAMKHFDRRVWRQDPPELAAA
ncbi:MAG: hypothetical protein ABTR92_19795 [Candidatus Accumulibacter phosphatis]